MKRTNAPGRLVRRATGLRNRRRHPKGTAAVELAVCLPALALLVFGSMQACDMIYLKHSLTTAAYEGSLEVARPDATDVTVRGRVEQVLQLRGVLDGSLTVDSAAVVQDLSIGDPVTITVRAPVKRNLKISGFFGSPNQLRVRFECTR